MKVLAVPKGTNPYQELIYSQLREQHPSDKFAYLVESRVKFFFYPLILIAKRIQGYKVVHLHWMIFVISHKIPVAKYFSFYFTLLCLRVPQLIGAKVVWTVHETTTHESWTFNDAELSRKLSRLADAKIVHSRFVLNDMKDKGMDISNTYIIPHGNYTNVYPNNVDRGKARKKLGLNDDEFVILFFGTIRRYKGVDNLVETFDNLKAKKNVRLIITGHCKDPLISEEIRKTANKPDSKINFYEGYVNDEDVAMYFNACDVVCLPFKKVTTSGSILLSLTFGKPVIAPRRGAIREIPDNVGFFYDPIASDGLKVALKEVIRQKTSRELKDMGKAALAYVKPMSWDNIAKQTYKVYQEVLNENLGESKLPRTKTIK